MRDDTVRLAARRWGMALAAWWAIARATCKLWALRRRTRDALRDLDPHLLRDIGVTHAQAQHEARLPFWL